MVKVASVISLLGKSHLTLCDEQAICGVILWHWVFCVPTQFYPVGLTSLFNLGLNQLVQWWLQSGDFSKTVFITWYSVQKTVSPSCTCHNRLLDSYFIQGIIIDYYHYYFGCPSHSQFVQKESYLGLLCSYLLLGASLLPRKVRCSSLLLRGPRQDLKSTVIFFMENGI
jgi:hypothetical protein